MRGRWLTMAVPIVALAMLAAVLVAPEAAQATGRPWCGIRWGSLAKSAGASEADWVLEGRVGRHRCYDRLVFEFHGPAAGATVRYVRRVPLAGDMLRQPKGGARLMVRLPTTLPPASATQGAVQADLAGLTGGRMFDVRGFRTFRDVRWGGVTSTGATIGLGVRARLPFRVFVLDGPGTRSRVVVDVAHRW